MKLPRLLKNGRFWLLLVLVLWNVVVIGGILLMPAKPQTGKARIIGSVYSIPGEPCGMTLVMETMTVHGSVQYYASGTDWIYFEQMAGGLRIMLGKNAEDVTYSEYTEGGIRYRVAEETLGTEIAWETADGYMFYLYSSLPAEDLRQVAACVTRTKEPAA